MRQDHLTEQEILAFKARTLSPSELLHADDHLASCSTCRGRVWNHTNGDRMVASLRDQLHATADPSVRKPAWTTAGLWTAAAAVLVAGTMTMLRESKPAPSTPPPVPVAQTLPAEYQAMLDQARRDGKVDRAPVLSELIRREGQLLAGGETEKSYLVLAPVGTVVLSDRPLLKWQAVPGASQYTVAIFDADYHKVAESPGLSATEWSPSTALSRGVNYSWQVTARLGKGATTKFPRPPAAEAVFRILDSSKASELDRARQSRGESHLLMGILYAREGLLDEAEMELKLANPAEAQRLLESLKNIRQD